MAERVIETKVKVTGVEDFVAGMAKITAAIKMASEAKKEFDALFEKAPNPVD